MQEVAADADAALSVALELAAQIAECDAGAVANAKQITRWPLNRDIAMTGRFAVEVGAFGAFGTQQFGPDASLVTRYVALFPEAMLAPISLSDVGADRARTPTAPSVSHPSGSIHWWNSVP